jgi:UDP-N-acetylmuramoylalanine--D-glutamate ligase
VVELSSFQLMSMRVSPDVSVVTNVTPNHLDVHGTMEEYVACKCNILDHQNAFSRSVISADNETAASLCPRVRGSLYRFSRLREVQRGSWLAENGDLCHSENGKTVRFLNRSEMKLRGLHNVENMLAASAAVWGFVTPEQIAEVGRTFTGVEHRIEPVRLRNGVQWYNDSIATSPTRMIAGLNSFDQKLIVIAGGYDKHIPFDVLGPEIVEHVKTLVLCGATADKIEEAVRKAPCYTEGHPVILRVSPFEKAVEAARDAAAEGDVVTLSPACAAFDQFKNFAERGKTFKAIVNSWAE